jgi:mortality factor 4-like protein 1
MAPGPVFQRDEKVLCFHHELLYEAKVLDLKLSDPADKKSAYLYKVHYKGWKNT